MSARRATGRHHSARGYLVLMRAMYSKLSTVTRSSQYVEITFENNHQQISVRMTEENAARLVIQLETKVNEIQAREKSSDASTN